MSRYLVVADETVGGRPLLAEIEARRRKGEARFMVLVPAAVPKEGLTWTESEARGLAEDRLERVLTHIRGLGAEATGEVADADPFLAIQDTLRGETFDEVILSAPSKRSGWMKPNLPAKVQSAFGMRVTYVQGERDEAVRETALLRSPLLAALPKRQLRSLAKASMVHSYRAGTTIVGEGTAEADLYAILDGRVKVIVDGHTVEHLSVGELFGEIALLSPGPRAAGVVAEAPTRCLQLPGRVFRATMASDNRLAAKVLEAAGWRMRDLSRNVRDAMSSLVLEGDLLEQLAESAHVEYCAEELAKGSAWGEASDEYLRRHDVLAQYAVGKRGRTRSGSSLVSYQSLPEQLKEQNRDLVQDIPKKLAAAGYVMRKLAQGEETARFSSEDIERLAEREHDRWVRLKLAQGWAYGPSRDDERRLHPSIAPWTKLSREQTQSRFGMDGAARVGAEALSDAEREKDRALMRKIGSMLARLGYTVAKADHPV